MLDVAVEAVAAHALAAPALRRALRVGAVPGPDVAELRSAVAEALRHAASDADALDAAIEQAAAELGRPRGESQD